MDDVPCATMPSDDQVILRQGQGDSVPKGWVTLREVCDRTGANPRNLKEWRRLGLGVPKPLQPSLGNKGTGSYFPPDTVRLVARIKELGDLFPRESTSGIGTSGSKVSRSISAAGPHSDLVSCRRDLIVASIAFRLRRRGRSGAASKAVSGKLSIATLSSPSLQTSPPASPISATVMRWPILLFSTPA